MENRRQKNLRERITAYFPELLALLFCAGLFLWGISLKEGYHMDELLSFELANAEFNPWIVPTQPQGRLAKFVEREIRGENFSETLSNLADTVKDVVVNRGNSKLLSYRADVYEEPVWIDRQTFVDYITVDEKDDFHYLSVYFNVKDDNHPPLHFMVLHTVSSIFKGKITPLMGCGINLVCVLGVMVLLMRMGRDIMGILGYEKAGRPAGLAAALLYGLSGGALATVLLIRMYAMLAFWCAALLAVHLRKLYGGSFQRRNGLLILVTVLGFWTQYFFLFYCLILAAVSSLLLWRRGRKKELWLYARARMTAAAVGVIGFPCSIQDVFSSGRGVEALENLGAGLSGYGTRLAAFAKILLERMGFGGSLAFLTALSGILILWGTGRYSGKFPGKGRESASLWMLLLAPTAGYFLLAARMAPYLVDRYLMPLFPLTILAAAAALFCLAMTVISDKRKRGKGWKLGGGLLFALLTAAQLLTPSRYQDNYQYRGYSGQKEAAERYRDYPCICVYKGVGYYENLVEFTSYEKTLLVTPGELENRRDKSSIAQLEQVVVLVKEPGDEARVREILLEQYGLYCAESLWRSRDPGADVLLLFRRVEAEGN